VNQTDRRTFSKTLAGGAYMALNASRVLGANDRIGVGIIGCGGQDPELAQFPRAARRHPVAVCDVFQPNRERAAAASKEKVAQYKTFASFSTTKTSTPSSSPLPITGTPC
jgi:hypothetical protein